MGRRTVITYVDDIDREELAPDEVRNVNFGFRGTDYVLDLSELNAEIFAEELEPYLKVARKVRASSGPRQAKGTLSANAARVQRAKRNQRIRDWANDNGFVVSSRGKLSDEVITAYEVANPQDI
ncbi:histone-like nucleoid-structuring protein Lsr2 [Corynebacterium sp. AOP40-9SA-29]|uniref:histone-like nucleoid-structuring protein Lsr2 n=1 Tax=Corynebacterium sp. AOP40-9SA-29 TaxID=3457677 RepID=UPI004033B3DA